MKKALFNLLKVIIAIVVIIVVVILILKAAEPLIFKEYYEKSQREYAIAGLGDGLTVQGLTYVDGENTYLQCGYMSGDAASRIYIVDKETGESRYIEMINEDGTNYTGHAGGIASEGDYVWVTGAQQALLLYSYTDLKNALNGDRLAPKNIIPVHTGTAFCVSDGTYLWVGEFYREQNYPTDATHHLTMPTGELNHSIAYGYKLATGIDTQEPANQLQAGETVTGLDSMIPEVALSIPDLAQGMARSSEGRFIISASYAVAKSKLYIYENVLDQVADSTISVEDHDIPLYYLDSDRLDHLVYAPPMSEDLDYIDGRVYIMYESATNKYIFGKLFDGAYVYSYPVQ